MCDYLAKVRMQMKMEQAAREAREYYNRELWWSGKASVYWDVMPWEVQRGSGYDDEIWVRCDEDEMEVDDDEEEEEEEEEDLSLASLVNLDHLRAAKLKEQRQNFDWTTDDWPEDSEKASGRPECSPKYSDDRDDLFSRVLGLKCG